MTHSIRTRVVAGFLLGLATVGGAGAQPNAVKDFVKTTGEGSSHVDYGSGAEVSLGRDTTDAHLKAFAKLPGKVVKLNLAPTCTLTVKGHQSGVTGAGLKELAGLRDLRWLRVPYTFTDADAPALAGCKNLETLLLFWTTVTNDALPPLAGLPKLKELDLSRAKVTDDCWVRLSDCRSLEKLVLAETKVTRVGTVAAGPPPLLDLDLSSTAVTNGGLAGLDRLLKLQKLDLSSTGVGDDGMRWLMPVKELRELRLRRTKTMDAGFRLLAGLTKLRHVDLSDTAAGDGAAKVLAGLPELRTVWMSGTPLTDAGLKELTRNEGLSELFLTGTKVTPTGVVAAKAALPNCRIDGP